MHRNDPSVQSSCQLGHTPAWLRPRHATRCPTTASTQAHRHCRANNWKSPPKLSHTSRLRRESAAAAAQQHVFVPISIPLETLARRSLGKTRAVLLEKCWCNQWETAPKNEVGILFLFWQPEHLWQDADFFLFAVFLRAVSKNRIWINYLLAPLRFYLAVDKESRKAILWEKRGDNSSKTQVHSGRRRKRSRSNRSRSSWRRRIPAVHFTWSPAPR